MSAAGAGFVNAHTHLYSGLVPLGMPAPSPRPRGFLEILERVWWRLDRALDHEILRASARFYVAEALLAGTTAVVDHHESPECIEDSLDVLADVCQELGMRAVLAYGATERNGGRAEARRGLAECRRFLETNARPFVRGVVGVHAGFTVSDETLREAGELAREHDTVVHVHLAEDEEDVRDSRARGYDGPLDRLIRCGALPRGSILAHGVHLSGEEVRTCADHLCWLVHNPRSNRANAVGWARALVESGRIALGTDGFPSDMIDEAEALVRGGAEHGQAPGLLGGRLDAGHRLIAERILRAPESDVAVEARRILVGGRAVVDDGRLLTADLEQIRAHAEEEARRLWRRMASL
jgi:cytosine/adenosine deaminase-related metal-dependent hydrolase